MKNAHVGRSRQILSQGMPHEERVQASPDYFQEALRILDNDITLEPQREHLTALWGLVIGLSRRLTPARVGCQDCRYAAMRTDRHGQKHGVKNGKKQISGKIASTAGLDGDGPDGAVLTRPLLGR